MNQEPANDEPPPTPEPPPVAVQPRTHVNSSMSSPYVPTKGAPVRTGADDHRLHPTKGSPT